MSIPPDTFQQLLALIATSDGAALSSPAAIPALRAHLRNYPLFDCFYSYLERSDSDLPAAMAASSLRGYLQRSDQALSGDLFWLNDETVTAAEEAAEDIPDDITLSDVVHADDPGLHALMVFERPMADRYAARSADNPLHGLTSFLDAAIVSVDASAGFFFGLRFIPTQPDQYSPFEAAHASDSGAPPQSGWWPEGPLAWWPADEQIGAGPGPSTVKVDSLTPEAQKAYRSRTRRRLAALYAIARDQRVFSQTPTVLPRADRRRLIRQHPDAAPNPTVRVISIGDPPEYTYERSESPASGPSRRGHLVRAHTRLQPYGPGRTSRRLRVIPAHWRGNMDDRLDGERVYSVARSVISTAGQQPPTDN